MAGDPPTEDQAGIDAVDEVEASGAAEATHGTLEPEFGGEVEVQATQVMDVDGPAGASTDNKARKEAEAMNVEAAVEELESKHALLQEEHEAAKAQLESKAKDLSVSQTQVKKLTDEKLQLEQQLAEAKRTAQAAIDGNKTVEQAQKSQKERMDRMEAEADSLREEIRCVCYICYHLFVALGIILTHFYSLY